MAVLRPDAFDEDLEERKISHKGRPVPIWANYLVKAQDELFKRIHEHIAHHGMPIRIKEKQMDKDNTGLTGGSSAAGEARQAMAEDNWKRRTEGMRCRTCMWYVEKYDHLLAAQMNIDQSPRGRCRRRCPTLGGWPVVFPTDWCGDHKLS